MIDNIDRKILYRLHKNSRSPLSLIAKDTGLTREVVGYRMKRMEEEGVIRGYPVKINQSFFCAGVAAIFFRIMRSDEKRFREILKFLQNHHSVHWMAELSGNADIISSIMYKNAEDLANTLSEMISFIGSNLKEHRISMYITEYKFEREGVLHPKPKQEIPAPIVSFGGKKEAKLDKTDIIILQELAKNCRIKNVDLAKKASISEDIVRLRIKRMEKEKIIFGYGITINLASIGLEPYLVELQIEQITKETLAKLQTYVHSNPYIIYCARTIGKYNVILNIHAKNAEHFNEIMLEIRNQFGTLLNNYEFQLEIKEMKEIYVPEGFLTT